VTYAGTKKTIISRNTKLEIPSFSNNSFWPGEVVLTTAPGAGTTVSGAETAVPSVPSAGTTGGPARPWLWVNFNNTTSSVETTNKYKVNATYSFDDSFTAGSVKNVVFKLAWGPDIAMFSSDEYRLSNTQIQKSGIFDVEAPYGTNFDTKDNTDKSRNIYITAEVIYTDDSYQKFASSYFIITKAYPVITFSNVTITGKRSDGFYTVVANHDFVSINNRKIVFRLAWKEAGIMDEIKSTYVETGKVTLRASYVPSTNINTDYYDNAYLSADVTYGDNKLKTFTYDKPLKIPNQDL
jgi:hypothetical protein